MTANDEGIHLTFSQFIHTAWFRAAARLALMGNLLLLGILIYMINTLTQRLERVEVGLPAMRDSIIAIDERGKARMILNDRFQTMVAEGMTAIRADTSSIRADLEASGQISRSILAIPVDPGPSAPDGR